MHYAEQKCPGRGDIIDIRLLGICSGLGAPSIICRNCKSTVVTGRKEWSEFVGDDTFCFILVSILEVAVLTMAGAVASGLAYNFITNGPWAEKGPFLNSGVIFGAISFLILGIGVQCHRVGTSLLRVSFDPQPIITSYVNLEHAVQWKMCLILLGVGIVGWLTSFAMSLIK